MEQSRSVLLVACQIATMIPETEKEFKQQLLNYIKRDLPYCAPEVLLMDHMWLRLEVILKRYIKDQDEPWREKIMNVYTGKNFDISSELCEPEDFEK